MRLIRLEEALLTPGTVLLERQGNETLLELDQQGAGIDMLWLKDQPERYLAFTLEALTEHSVAVNLLVYSDREPEAGAVFDVTTGVLPGIRTGICLDTKWLEGNDLFPENCVGQLKVVCHGRRVERDEISKMQFLSLPMNEKIKMKVSDLVLTDVWPGDVDTEHIPEIFEKASREAFEGVPEEADEEASVSRRGTDADSGGANPVACAGILKKWQQLPDAKLVDELGQNKKKDWPSKLRGERELKELLHRQAQEVTSGYPFADWSSYGGWKEKKLTRGTGFFSKIKENGRWWLVDPEGYAFFSMGPDGVGIRSDCRIDGVEKWMDWLPDREDPVYGPLYEVHPHWPMTGERRRECTLFSYEQANLMRAFGQDWYEAWKQMVPGQLRKYGMNTLGNWSDPALLGTTGTAYVTSLRKFPDTKQHIFRDFPDVFSEEYEEDAKACARDLIARKDDPLMIGYFLRNEPSWAFVDHLVLADEVLFNPARTVCKDRLIETLREKYHTVEALNAAYHSSLPSFEALYDSQKQVSSWSQAASEDMRAFSRKMLDAYVGIPTKACRQVDPNHMILGMRWAWISDPDVVTGWEYFDVFSINCYAVDPTAAIQNIVNLGVDLPVMIGEFHFGALDVGPSATGLEGVMTQRDRGLAYRYYCERVAAHPYGVGCHYFQCYDQFTLGRFDGENYNIGIFDICSQPYPEMAEGIRRCAETIYAVADGLAAPTREKGCSSAMIAY